MTRLEVRAVHSDRIGWMYGRSGYAPASDFCAIEAVDERGLCWGMVGFDHWMWASGEIHVALAHPIAARALIPAAFDYFFGQLRRDVLLGRVPESNRRVRAFARHLGFRETHRVKDGVAKGDDIVFLEMRREECRWLPAERSAA